MINTTDKVVESIKNNKEGDFLNLIGVPLDVIGKDKEYVHSDFLKIRKYFIDYNIQPKYELSDSSIDNSQKAVIIFSLIDTTLESKSKVQFYLKFGPPQINPLEKISGYEIERIN